MSWFQWITRTYTSQIHAWAHLQVQLGLRLELQLEQVSNRGCMSHDSCLERRQPSFVGELISCSRDQYIGYRMTCIEEYHLHRLWERMWVVMLRQGTPSQGHSGNKSPA